MEPNKKPGNVSIRKEQAPPIVKQTLTSARRILLASNPLAKFETWKSRYGTTAGGPSASNASMNTTISLSADILRLQENLNKWLKSRGKPPVEFYNLRKMMESNKKRFPNMVINEVVDCKFENDEGDLRRNAIPEEGLSEIALEAVKDLMLLVEQGYPTSECLKLSDLVKEKFGKIDDAPEYWELRARIDEAAGNIAGAVENFNTAIIHGAQVSSVNKALDGLLGKFSSLNISPSKLVPKTKEEIEKDRATDALKTRKIMFSIKERDAKKKRGTDEASRKKFIATPVKRSSRLTNSVYKSTPGVNLFRSLKQAGNADDISFSKNKALI